MQIIDEKDLNAAAIAAKFLRDGKIIAFATDTVYGIACDASNSKAIDSLYKIKNRDIKKPIAIFVKNITIAKKIFIFDELAKKTIQEFASKPLTLVLKTKLNNPIKLADNLNLNDDNSKNKFLGFRIVNHKFVKNLLKEFDGILAVSSANISGLEPATKSDVVKKYFPNLDLLIDGGQLKLKNASTVIKISNKKLQILRP